MEWICRKGEEGGGEEDDEEEEEEKAWIMVLPPVCTKLP